MTGRRRSRLIPWLIAGIMVVLIAETTLVVFVFASPEGAVELQGTAAGVSEAWNGTDEEPGLRTKAARALSSGYHEWIAPLWTGRAVSSGELQFNECVECHQDYAAKRRFTSVYMDHPLHAELGVACDTCHTQTVHPNPGTPAEATCEECHVEVDQKGECSTCHPPGSLPHFYLLGAPRTPNVECDVCHPKDTFTTDGTTPLIPSASFDGDPSTTCRACHETTTCARCHAEPHPPGWSTQHSTNVPYGGASTCMSCHTTTWCADRCHAVTSNSPFSPKPLPDEGIQP